MHVCCCGSKGADRNRKKIAKERKEDRGACVSCAESEIKAIVWNYAWTRPQTPFLKMSRLVDVAM